MNAGMTSEDGALKRSLETVCKAYTEQSQLLRTVNTQMTTMAESIASLSECISSLKEHVRTSDTTQMTPTRNNSYAFIKNFFDDEVKDFLLKAMPPVEQSEQRLAYVRERDAIANEVFIKVKETIKGKNESKKTLNSIHHYLKIKK